MRLHHPSAFLSLGLLALTAGALSARQNAVVVTGVVVDAASGSPIEDATIRLNGREVGRTDQQGRFRIGTDLRVSDSPHRLAAARIGYAAGERVFSHDDETLTVDVVIQLEPVPVELEAINVRGEEVELTTARMSGFYRRRDNTPGYFFTREDIRRTGAQRVTEVVRRVPGTVIYSADNTNTNPLDPNARAAAFEHPTMIQFQRQGYARGAPCQPLIFVNDMAVMDRNIDWMIPTQSIAGIEVYTSSAQVPAEYNKAGASCGVLVVWTDGPIRSQGTGLVRVMEVGGVASWRMRNGLEGERFGVQLLVPLFGAFEFHPNFNLIVGNTSEGDAGWQALAALKWRPLGKGTPLFVGAGGTIIKNRTSVFQSQRLSGEETRAHLLGVTGVSIPIGPFRPFIEFQIVDPFSEPDGYLSSGLTVRHR